MSNNKSFKKLIIWGHKLGTHTHSYVHNGYYRAAKYMGYDTYWFDDKDDTSNFDFANSIFITEVLSSKGMPIRNDCVYFNHWSDLAFELTDKWTKDRVVHPNYYNFIYFADRWSSNNAVLPPKEEIQELADKHYFHQKTKTITTIWATDLLPYEIDDLEPCLFDETQDSLYFVGSRNGPNIQAFEDICLNNGKRFTNVGGYTGVNSIHTGMPPTIEQNINMIRNSFISVDIREWEGHMKGGRYYPCRVFKNISYGKWTGSNHSGIEDLFEGNITCESNLELLYEKLVKDSRDCNYEKMRNAMNFIRDKHTYVNRINDMLKILN